MNSHKLFLWQERYKHANRWRSPCAFNWWLDSGQAKSKICILDGNHFKDVLFVREAIPAAEYHLSQTNRCKQIDGSSLFSTAIVLHNPGFIDIFSSLMEFSSLRKTKTILGGTGIQKEVATLSTIPGGLPGSSTHFLDMTPTSSTPLPDIVVHVCAVKAPSLVQKLNTILSASFNTLFLPSEVVITCVVSEVPHPICFFTRLFVIICSHGMVISFSYYHSHFFKLQFELALGPLQPASSQNLNCPKFFSVSAESRSPKSLSNTTKSLSSIHNVLTLVQSNTSLSCNGNTDGPLLPFLHDYMQSKHQQR